MRGLPRRLPHSEEATFVEHLEELRWRIIIVLGALALTTIVAFAFHGHVLDWLNHALPADRRQPVTLGAAGDPLAALVIPGPCIRPVDRTAPAWAGRLRHGPRCDRARIRLLDPAPA